jgi:DNA-directed RNA polymerase specialized sigma24 family protein
VRLGCRETASDVVQSAFLRAVKSRRRFRGVENPVAYMFQIARNEAAREMRRRKVKLLPVDEVFETASNANTNWILAKFQINPNWTITCWVFLFFSVT